MRALLLAVAFVACGAGAQAPAPDVAWPREVKAKDGTTINADCEYCHKQIERPPNP